MLKAVFSRFGEEIELTDELWQYDFGQKIQVTGIELPDVCEVHFQYDNLTETKTVTGYKQENALIIDIPNEALTSRGIIKLYIYLVSSEEGRTVNVAIMHVNRRMKPEGFEVPEDIDLFHHTLLAANEYMQQTKSAKKSAETAANQAEDAKNAAEAAAGSAQTSADEAKTAKENAETAAKVAEAFKTETKTAKAEAVQAAADATAAKKSAEEARAAAEKAKQDAEAAKAAADVDKEAAETARSEAETAKNDAVQAKEAAEKAKIGTAADRETAETASKVARVSAMSAEESAKKAETAKEEIQESADQIQKNAIEIDSLKEEIDTLFVKSRNLLNLTVITPNTWISNESGSINKYDGYSSTDYIPIGRLSTLFFVCISNGIYKDVGGNFGAYYDAEKHYISGFSGVALGIAVPPNAKYVKVSNSSKYFDENVKPIISSTDIWNPKPTTVKEYEIYVERRFNDSENVLPNVYKKISELETNGYTIPSYYIEYLQEKELQTRNNYEKCGEHGDSFVFITDYHDTSNSGNSVNLIHHIMDNSPVGFVCLNGDLINDKATKDLGRQSMINVIQKFCYLPTDKFFVTVGNHEFNNAGNSESYRDRQLSISEVYSIVNKKSETFIRDVDGYDYYVDNKAQKIRYYFIGSTIGSNPYSGATKWIAESLAGIENGYSAIIFSHIGLNSSANDWESSFDKIVAILEAYKNHTAYMLDGKNYDFSSKDGDVIGIFSGHMHLDGAITTTAGIPFIATTCDAYREEYGKLLREKGTITEQAFDVVQIDRINRNIYMTRIGAGNNREFSY